MTATPTSPFPDARYRHDAATGVWLPVDRQAQLDYSDGPCEQHLLEALRQIPDVGSGSDALPPLMVDWPSRYHLSHLRANLLRPLADHLRGDVLEVGAGCGALTRYLGETARAVVAVEGTLPRAQVARERCRDLSTVQVVADDIMAVSTARRFDAVTLVGVLEYSRRYIDAADPIAALLQHCAGLLRPGGALIVAIENQLGLKYFAGAPEDHLGQNFVGIHDGYGKKTPVTFGHRELRARLAAAGLPQSEFWLPFPDYKLPHLVVSAAVTEQDAGALQNILTHVAAPQQGIPYQRTFAEEAAWPALIRNGLLTDLANSFLVVARREVAAAAPAPLAFVYASDRARCFAKALVLRRREDGAYVATRTRLYPRSKAGKQPRRNRLQDEPWLPGTLYARGLTAIVNRPGWGPADVAAWAAPWVAYLQRQAVACSVARPDLLLPPHLVDCIPLNFLVGDDGALRAFDLEWVAPQPISAAWVLWRGLYWTLRRLESCAEPQTPLATVEQAALASLAHLGWLTTPAQRAAVRQQEEAFFGLPLASGAEPPLPVRATCLWRQQQALQAQLAAAQQQADAATAAQHAAQQQAVDSRRALASAATAAWQRRARRPRQRLRRLLGAAKPSLSRGCALLQHGVDADYYLTRYPDVAAANLAPIEHYVRYGADEGRWPNAWFDTAHYLQANPDVAASGINPLLHFLAHGHAEGRATA